MFKDQQNYNFRVFSRCSSIYTLFKTQELEGKCERKIFNLCDKDGFQLRGCRYLFPFIVGAWDKILLRNHILSAPTMQIAEHCKCLSAQKILMFDKKTKWESSESIVNLYFSSETKYCHQQQNENPQKVNFSSETKYHHQQQCKMEMETQIVI